MNRGTLQCAFFIYNLTSEHKKTDVYQRRARKWSGQPDSNRRLPAPKAGALARLSYAPL